MKAVILESFGDLDQLQMGEVAEPKLFEGDVLIKTRASGLNGADLLQRQGFYPPPKGASEILGLEVSGVIEALDSRAEKAGWKKGDPVMALLAGGGYAEKVAIRHDQLLPVPANIDLVAAGGITEVFVTAYLELVLLGSLQKGERLLIHAGASGVGSAAIQIAKSLGAEVWVTAGTQEKLDFCKELGADHGINYKTERFADRIKEKCAGVNVILDLVGASHFEQNIAALALDGRLLLVGLSGGRKAEIDMGQVLAKRAQIIGSTLRSRTLDDKARILKSFWEFAEPKFKSGEFKAVVDKVYPAEKVKDAQAYMEAKKNRGKILLEWG